MPPIGRGVCCLRAGKLGRMADSEEPRQRPRMWRDRPGFWATVVVASAVAGVGFDLLFGFKDPWMWAYDASGPAWLLAFVILDRWERRKASRADS
jgi:hypothetical protein